MKLKSNVPKYPHNINWIAFGIPATFYKTYENYSVIIQKKKILLHMMSDIINNVFEHKENILLIIIIYLLQFLQSRHPKKLNIQCIDTSM